MKNATLFVVMLLALLLLYRECGSIVNPPLPEITSMDTPIIRHYQDREGLQHAVTTIRENQTGAPVTAISKKIAVNPAKIKQVTNAVTTTSDTIPAIATHRVKDTTVFDYEDDWISIHGVLHDSVQITYRMRDSIWLTAYQKRTGLFRKVTLLDGFSANPNTTITGLQSISLHTLNRRQARLSIGPSFGYHYAGGKFQWSAGIGIQYNFIRF